MTTDHVAVVLALYDEALPQVYGYLRARVDVRVTAEDLTAETFLAAVGQARRGAVEEVTVAWLIGIARHKLADHWRSAARRPLTTPISGPITGPTTGPTTGSTTGPTTGPTTRSTGSPIAAPVTGSTTGPTTGSRSGRLATPWSDDYDDPRDQGQLGIDDPWDAVLETHRVEAVLAQLGAQHRSALTFRYLDGLAVAEVAAVMQRTVHATEALLVRARRAFRECYLASSDDGDDHRQRGDHDDHRQHDEPMSGGDR